MRLTNRLKIRELELLMQIEEAVIGEELSSFEGTSKTSSVQLRQARYKVHHLQKRIDAICDRDSASVRRKTAFESQLEAKTISLERSKKEIERLNMRVREIRATDQQNWVDELIDLDKDLGIEHRRFATIQYFLNKLLAKKKAETELNTFNKNKVKVISEVDNRTMQQKTKDALEEMYGITEEITAKNSANKVTKVDLMTQPLENFGFMKIAEEPEDESDNSNPSE